MINFNTSKSVVTSVLNKNTGILSIDRYNDNSTVREQAMRQLGESGEVVKVTIETGNKKYTIQYEQD